MKRFLAPSIVLIIAIVVAASAVENPQPQPSNLPVGSATIAEFKGEISIRSPQGEAVTPQRGLVLAPESRIEIAKGSMLLNLPDGSQVLIKSRTQVVLKAPDQANGSFLELLLGRVINKVQKRLGNAPSFRMGTPTAVITVRGTRFSVEVNKKQRTTVEVFEGLVEVQGLGAFGVPVLIRPGFSTWVERNRNPERPHEMHNLREGPEDRIRQPGMERDDRDRGSRQEGPESPSGKPDHDDDPH
jgi:hypothetical protein